LAENKSAAAVEVSFRAYNSFGQELTADGSTLRLQGGELRTIPVNEFPEGTATVRFDGPAVVSLYVATPDGRRAESVAGLETAGTHLFFPNLVLDNSLQKRISLANTGDSLDVPVLVGLDKNGVEIFRRALPALPAHGAQTILMADLEEPSILTDLLMIRVDSNQPLVGMQLTGVAGGDLVGLPAVLETGTEFNLDITPLKSNSKFWVSIGMVNAGEKDVTRNVDFLGRGEGVLGSAGQIQVKANTVGSLREVAEGMPRNAEAIRIRSVDPFAAYAVFGRTGSWAVAAELIGRQPGRNRLIVLTDGQLVFHGQAALPSALVNAPIATANEAAVQSRTGSTAPGRVYAAGASEATVVRPQAQAPLNSAAPSNDDVNNPANVTSLPFFQTEDISGATTVVTDPFWSCASRNQGTNTVWFRYTADDTGDIKVSTVGSSYDTVLTAYPGAVQPGPELVCNDDSFFALVSQITLHVTSGQTYLIEASHFGSTPTTGTLVIAITRIQRRAQRTGIYRSTSTLWVLDYDGNGAWDGNIVDRAYPFGTGLAGEVAVVGDWNGDGRTKIGTFRNGEWRLDMNGNGVFDSGDVLIPVGGFGTAGDIPVVGDWNGDGRTKIGIFRNGLWLLDFNGNFQWDGPPTDKLYNLGTAGDVPLVGDWLGNGFAKIGIYRGINGVFFVLDYLGNGSGTRSVALGGLAGDIPVVGDWNGTGYMKVGIFRGGTWLLDYNGNFAWDGPPADRLMYLGQNGDTPVTGNWKGDGVYGVGVFRPSQGLWVLDFNANGTWDGKWSDWFFGLGQSGDQPVVGAW
jgi:hypothetical protein